MTERMKTFIYCAITAVVTTIVITVGQPQAAQAQVPALPKSMTITHKVTLHISFAQFSPLKIQKI